MAPPLQRDSRRRRDVIVLGVRRPRTRARTVGASRRVLKQAALWRSRPDIVGRGRMMRRPSPASKMVRETSRPSRPTGRTRRWQALRGFFLQLERLQEHAGVILDVRSRRRPCLCLRRRGDGATSRPRWVGQPDGGRRAAWPQVASAVGARVAHIVDAMTEDHSGWAIGEGVVEQGPRRERPRRSSPDVDFLDRARRNAMRARPLSAQSAASTEEIRAAWWRPRPEAVKVEALSRGRRWSQVDVREPSRNTTHVFSRWPRIIAQKILRGGERGVRRDRSQALIGVEQLPQEHTHDAQTQELMRCLAYRAACRCRAAAPRPG